MSSVSLFNIKNQKELSRANVSRALGTLLLTAFNSGCGSRSPSQKPSSITEPDVFPDREANEIAKRLGITPSNYLIFTSNVLDRLKAHTSDRLYPIQPPAVLAQRKLIYTLTDEFGVAPNIIATLMAIESAGVVNAGSYVAAQGLFQVMPFHFSSNIQSDPSKMREPYTNGRVGMRFFTEVCLPIARNGFSDSLRNHPATYARAFMAYNGGSEAAYIRFDRLPEETKFYGDHLIRYLMTAEVADGLRSKGRNDAEIVKKLVSPEMDARAYALNRFVEGTGRRYPYTQYIDVLKELGRPVPGSAQLNRDYNEYKRNPSYGLPVSPGLRIWLALGGIDLFRLDPRNMDRREWDKLPTSRN